MIAIPTVRHVQDSNRATQAHSDVQSSLPTMATASRSSALLPEVLGSRDWAAVPVPLLGQALDSRVRCHRAIANGAGQLLRGIVLEGAGNIGSKARALIYEGLLFCALCAGKGHSLLRLAWASRLLAPSSLQVDRCGRSHQGNKYSSNSPL